MKRYIKANLYSISQDRLDLVKSVANDVLRNNRCSAKYFNAYSGTFGLYLTKFEGSSKAVKDGYPCVDGYTGYYDRCFFDEYELANYDEDKLTAYIQEKLERYLVKFKNKLNDLRVVIDRIPGAEAASRRINEAVIDYYTSRGYSDVSSESEMSIWAEDRDFYLESHDEPEFKFNLTIDGKTLIIQCDYDSVMSGDAVSKIISRFSSMLKKEKRNSETTSGSKLKSLLAEYNIDTTMSEYELYAEKYEGFSSGRRYRKKFKCPGDYLAYLSMNLHTAPNYANIVRYYGDIGTFEEDVLEENPTLADIADLASTNWWGDGDDYIIYLKNLTTGETLYEGGEPEEEYDEENWED